MKKQFLEAGRIVGTHGIRGEVRIDPWCDSPEFLCGFESLYLDSRGESSVRVKCRPHKNITLCTIEGVDSIDAAEKLRGTVVYISRDDIELEDGVNFVQDLIGLEVRDFADGRFYGKISDVIRTGANDVYEIENGGKKFLAPVIDEVIKKIDVDGGYVLIVPMKGIFDE